MPLTATDAIEAMRVRASVIEIERARIAGALLAICDAGGFAAAKAAADAEVRRLARARPVAAARDGYVA